MEELSDLEMRVLADLCQRYGMAHGELWIGAVVKEGSIQEVRVEPRHRVIVRLQRAKV